MLAEVKRRRFTADEYLRMGETGIIGPEERVELIEGDVIQMSPIGPRHRGCVNRGTELFVLALSGRTIVSPQSSIRLNKHSEPEPDIVLFKPRADYYVRSHVTAENCFLVVEVAESSLRYDTKVKLPLYAKSGVPEVWIEDLRNERLLVYRDPSDTAYATCLTLKDGDSISPLAFPDMNFSVRDLLLIGVPTID